MKKNTIIAVALATFLGASGCNSIWSEPDLPDAVKVKFVGLYPSITAVDWEQESGLYEAEFEISGRERKALFQEDGALVSYSEAIEEHHLPSPILELLQQQYSQYKVEEVHRVQKGGAASFEVELQDRNEERLLLLDADGRILQELPSPQHAATTQAAASLLPSATAIGYAASTDLGAPSSQWALPAELREVSGISMLPDGLLACVQDEEGKIFLYDLNQKAIVDEIKFAGPGDYEGIAIVGADAFILRSDGTLFEVKDFRSRQGRAIEHKANLPATINVEGLAYDAANNRLLLAPKGHDAKQGAAKGLYAFSLADKKLQPQPVVTISLSQAQLNGTGKKKESGYDVLQPSSLEVHPETGTLYLLDAANNRLLTIDTQGAIQKVVALDKGLLRQAEGLTFGPNGEMYIASEGSKKGTGVLVAYPRGI